MDQSECSKEIMEEKREKRRIYMQKYRARPEIRERERISRATAQRISRTNPEVAQKQRVTRTAAQRMSRTNPEVVQNQRVTRAAAQRISRLNPEVAQNQRVTRTAAQRISRMNPEVVQNQRVTRAAAQRISRLNPNVVQNQRVTRAAAQRISRLNPEVAQNQRVTRTAAQRISRLNPEVAQNQRVTRTAAQRISRQNPVVIERQRFTRKLSQRKSRKNPLVRSIAQEYDKGRKRRHSKELYTNYQKLLQTYSNKIKMSPEFICSCCGGLWYKPDTTEISEEDLLEKGWTKEKIEQILSVHQNTHRLCGTCKATINRKRIPKLCLSNGFAFPEIPEELKCLSPLEERLVAARLPFMQIRATGLVGQLTMKGNVVNVENDLDICAKVLPNNVIPRRFDDTSTIQVKLMRRMGYKNPYMYETIRPHKVMKAAQYLVSTPLYKNAGIQLSEDWYPCNEDQILDFETNPDDPDPPEYPPENFPIVHSASQRAQTDPQDPPIESIFEEYSESQSMGADETLFFMDANTDALGVMIAPGEGKQPMSLFSDQYAEELSWPTVHCGIARKFKEKLKVTYTDIAKSELRRYDRRACRKHFYTFKKSFNEKVRNAVQICLRKKVGDKKVTASQLRTKEFLKDLLFRDEGYAVFKQIRSTPTYWMNQKKKAIAMVRQQGKATFFITLSAAETKWVELLVTLMKVVHGKIISKEEAEKLSYDEKVHLIRSDPVTCMRNFDHRFRALLNVLFKKEGGIFNPYKLVDYFTRMEFQLRGSPHSHGLYWLENSPTYVEGEVESEKQCAEFIDQYITTQRNCEDNPTVDSLIGYQIHNHSQTCYKRGQKCRFSFPKPPLPETKILTPLEKDFDERKKNKVAALFTNLKTKLNEMGRSYKEDVPFNDFLETVNMSYENYLLCIRSSINRPTVFYKRKTNAIFVNPYNVKLLEAWGANIDFQFVLDTYACAKYCVGYIMKQEGGVSRLLQTAVNEAKRGNVTVQEKLKRIANVLVNGSEISAQESVAFQLQISNTMCSRSEIFVNTSLPENRVGILKSKLELESLEDSSEDVVAKGILHHYAKREPDMENLCLADFSTVYDFVRKTPAKSLSVMEEAEVPDCERSETEESSIATKKMRKRKKRKILRFRNFGKHQDEDNYWREQLMLFVPWRNEEEELININSTIVGKEKLDLILTNSKPYYFSRELENFDDIISSIQEDDESENYVAENENALAEDEDYSVEEQFGIETSQKQNIKHDYFLPPKMISSVEYDNLMRTLNNRQRRFVYHVLKCFKTDRLPFYLFLSGGAGVGKSHAIYAIVQSFLLYNMKHTVSENPDQLCVVVSAPTGKAAFNVFGTTLHCTFRLPPTQYAERLTDLDDSTVSTLRNRLQKVKLFIIDEISMVSSSQLYQIDQRMRQIFASDEDFGGKSVLVVGHLRQLPPVGGSLVFKLPSSRHIPLTQCVGNYLWQKFHLYELDEIMRQKGDFAFCKALNNMAEGSMDDDDVSLIKSREISETNIPPDDCIWLFWTNKQCEEHNRQVHEKLQLVNKFGCVSNAYDRIQGTGTKVEKDALLEEARLLNRQQSDGLPYSTYLQTNAEYFVSTNIDVPDGLFNGTTGKLEQIDKKRNVKGDMVPYRAWLDFRQPLIGSIKRQTSKAEQERRGIPLRWTPIERITKRLNKRGRRKGLEIVREQIPLVAANGRTINKAQGDSIPRVVLSVRSLSTGRRNMELSRELKYVGASRATSLAGLFIDGEFKPPNKPPDNDPVTIEMSRLRSIDFPFSMNFLQDYGVRYQKLYCHNIRSFTKHFQDVRADQCAMASDFVVFLEPKTYPSFQIHMPEFKLFHHSPSGGSSRNPNSEGIIALCKPGNETTEIQFFTKRDSGSHFLCFKWKIREMTVMSVYKSPKYPVQEFMKSLMDIVKQVIGNGIIVGDMNIDLHKRQGDELRCNLEALGYYSKICLSDISTDTSSHIDVCFSNSDGVQSWFYESYYSDHKPICAVWPI